MKKCSATVQSKLPCFTSESDILEHLEKTLSDVMTASLIEGSFKEHVLSNKPTTVDPTG
jgi:hypothetical protein